MSEDAVIGLPFCEEIGVAACVHSKGSRATARNAESAKSAKRQVNRQASERKTESKTRSVSFSVITVSVLPFWTHEAV
jgi:hypothetical protein